MDSCRAAALATACVAVLLMAGCARETRCALCQMIVPAETRTTALVDGREQVICDPRCALTEEHQRHRAIRLTKVTDLESREALDPRTAFYLSGSDTAPDAHDGGMRTWPAGQASLQWHRCLPSVLAFGSRDAGERYARQHGGRLLTYDELGFADSRPGPGRP